MTFIAGERSVERGATFAFYWVFMVQLSSGLATPGVKVLVQAAVGNKVQNDNYQLTLGVTYVQVLSVGNLS